MAIYNYILPNLIEVIFIFSSYKSCTCTLNTVNTWTVILFKLLL